MEFPGFEQADFDLFQIDDFAGRMAEIRARLRPKLVALAGELAPEISALIGAQIHPHAAQHMRRRVNPPAETWAAWARDARGYKRWTHYRVAVSGAGVRVTVFVEDDADDKPQLGQNLQVQGAEIIEALQGQNVQWYTLGEGTPHDQVTAEALTRLGDQLQRLKTPKFQAGIPVDRSDPTLADPNAFCAHALQLMRTLLPLYQAGAEPELRL